MLPNKAAKPFAADLNKQLNRQVKSAINEALGKHGPSRSEIDQAVKQHKTLRAAQTSDCFESVTFKDGMCTCVFARDGYVWNQSMSTADFLDAFGQTDSLGQAWNEDYHGVPSE